MAVFKIVRYDDSIWRRRIGEVASVTEKVRGLVCDMIETMHSAVGVGIAAPQVGVAQKIIVVLPMGSFDNSDRKSIDRKSIEEMVLINPVILKRSGSAMAEEGCLSVPGVSARIRRAERITVEGLDIEGKRVVWDAEGWTARIFQHEIDHLSCRFFFDRLPFLKRREVLRKLRRKK